MLDESNGKAQFICTAKTVEKFPLVIASKYNIPYLINKSNVGNVSSELLRSFSLKSFF